MRPSYSYFLIVAVLIQVFIYSCTKGKKKDVHAGPGCISDSMMRILKFDTIKVSKLVEELKLTGKITFNEDRLLHIYAPVGGIVEKVNVTLGDYVEEGQVIADIRSSEMASYTSEYKTAMANLKIAKKTLDVTSELERTGVVSHKDYLIAKENYEIAVAEVNRTKRVARIFGDSTRGIYHMKAPISGYIVEKNISQGMTLKLDNDAIAFTLSDLKEVWVLANVFDHDLKKIKIGDSVFVKTLAYDKDFPGIISKISRSMNLDTKVTEVRIVLLNHELKLQPGMYSGITVKLADKDMELPYISKDAFVFEENKYFLITFKDTCHLEIINVKPHSIIGDIAYLNKPAPVGSKIVSKHQSLIYSMLNKKE